MSTAATAGGLPAQNAAPQAAPPTARATIQVEGADPLLHPDPAVAADCAGTESLLRCWVRETGVTEPAGGVLRVALGDGLQLSVPVRYWSACGWHRFGRASLVAGTGSGYPVDAVTVAALLARGSDPAEAASPRHVADLAGRVVDSVRRTARFITEHREAPGPPAGTTPFLDTEQSLLLGHPLHPTPKSREGLGEAETAAYSPELRGAHPLHWFAVDADLAATDSALPQDAAAITAALRGDDGPALPPGTVALPLHPWQARELTHRPAVRKLLDAGRLHDLGSSGRPWYPTSSVRTLYQPGTPYMLKLSLGLRITNSRRENLRKELHRGVEVHRLLNSGLGREWQAAHPGFDIVRDPAWVGVDLPVPGDSEAGRSAASGLDTVIRQSPFGPGDRAHCVAGLVAERPSSTAAGGPARSRLGELLHTLAARTGRPTATVATEWFLRYLDAMVLPLLWLDGQAGIALEAHQQNSLVLLDAHGWPSGGRYRDNQGYYFRDSRAADLDARLRGIGQDSDTFVPDAVADERFAYYLGFNHLLGLIGAFGSQRLADERVLLAALRRFLAGPAAAATGSTLPALLLDADTLRCKANLLTRLHGLDELVGPVETQSVYVTVANPVASSVAVRGAAASASAAGPAPGVPQAAGAAR
ncbi:IucA/IucC family siderophore biosynthesis protein [Streptacidiphilus sp. N1-3]|uniref:IucA/IucC family siderophore biosynthesis protein n=1 Tax=Streptacidiphilus alkalitolerans TaxID=3342712 RepID=A0ABV6X922_9ACTN